MDVEPSYILVGFNDPSKRSMVGVVYRGGYYINEDNILIEALPKAIFKIKGYSNIFKEINKLLENLKLPKFKKRGLFGYPWRDFFLTSGAGYYIANTKNVKSFIRTPTLWSLLNIHEYVLKGSAEYSELQAFVTKLLRFFQRAFILSEMYRVSVGLLDRVYNISSLCKNIGLRLDHLGYGYIIDLKTDKCRTTKLDYLLSSIHSDFEIYNLIKKIESRGVLL